MCITSCQMLSDRFLMQPRRMSAQALKALVSKYFAPRLQQSEGQMGAVWGVYECPNTVGPQGIRVGYGGPTGEYRWNVVCPHDRDRDSRRLHAMGSFR